MKIFRPMNLLIEMGDWLSKNQFKLGHLSYIGASRELWFKFDIASMILENWERVLKVPWNKFDLWVEKSKIDMLMGIQPGSSQALFQMSIFHGRPPAFIQIDQKERHFMFYCVLFSRKSRLKSKVSKSITAH